MVSAFSPNIQLEEPARGDQVGTWDTPVNNNMTLLDKVVGATTSISLNNSNVVLSSPQFQSKTIIFQSTLTGSVTITFPTSFVKSYEIYNACTGSSAFTITLLTTTAAAQVIGAPPGEVVDIINLGGQMVYKNLGRTGSYWDYAGSSVPAWVSLCTIKPYLNCDGTTFSAATYPALATILGSTTLPDSRGRFRAANNQTTGRITTAVSSVNGDVTFSVGGAQSLTVATSNVPSHTHQITDPGHTHTLSPQLPTYDHNTVGGGGSAGAPTGGSATVSAVTGITVNNSTYANGAIPAIPPCYIGGLTLIRSA